MTINRSLQYLVTEEIEEQDIVYGQMDGQPDDGRKGIALELKMLLFLIFLIQFDSFTKYNGNLSLINNMDYMSIMT